jgi:AcrR family transcriptional regulator
MKTREKLFRVASRLFAERGYDGTSVRDIVAAADANLGAVTYHFGSKEALFGEVLLRKMAPLRRVGEEIAASDLRPEEKIRAMLTAYAEYVLHKDPGLKVLFAETVLGGERLPAEVVEAVEWRNRIFAEAVREGIRRGDFRDCDVESAAWIFFGMLSAYVLYEPLMGKKGRTGSYPPATVKRIVETALDLFFNGIRKGRGGSRQSDGCSRKGKAR